MRRVDEPREPCRAAVGRMRRGGVEPVVPPAAVAGVRRDRHQLDRGDAELTQLPQPRDDAVEGARGREGADVELVDDELVEPQPWTARRSRRPPCRGSATARARPPAASGCTGPATRSPSTTNAVVVAGRGGHVRPPRNRRPPSASGCDTAAQRERRRGLAERRPDADLDPARSPPGPRRAPLSSRKARRDAIRPALPGERLLHGAGGQDAAEMAPEVRARHRVGGRARPGVGLLRGGRDGVARGALRAPAPSAVARSGVEPMFVSPIRALPIVPLPPSTTAATPTVAQSTARRRNLTYDQPAETPPSGRAPSTISSSGSSAVS